MADSSHEKLLEKLCRICGELCSTKFKVTEHFERISKAFLVYLDRDDPNIHPKHICHPCYSTMTNVEARQTTTQIKPLSWEAHMEIDCVTCQKMQQLRKGGGKFKKKKIGRPSKKLWSRIITNNILKKTPEDIVPYACSIESFSAKLNPHLKLCMCALCRNILRKPLLLVNCEHCFCSNCILPKLEGKFIENIVCPVCETKIKEEDVVSPKYVTSIIGSLQVGCSLGCGENFTLAEHDEKIFHENSCVQNSRTKLKLTLADTLSLDDCSDISRDVEDAALQVIRHKMRRSTLPNKSIEFKTAGPRV